MNQAMMSLNAKEQKEVADFNMSLLELPRGRKAVGLRWVLKSNITVMDGWSDTNETFSPVVRFNI